MSRFSDARARTPRYLAAVEAVRRLFAEGGYDAATRAFGDAVAPEREGPLLWPVDSGSKHWRRSSGHPCIWRLAVGRCPNNGTACRVPGAGAHAELFLRDGKPAAYVSHDYDLSLAGLRRLTAFADEYGLDVRVTAASRYFPGRTVMVVLTKRDEEDA